MKDLVINTGAPRNILGHIVSGAVASALISGTINYKKVQEKKTKTSDALADTIKKTSQGAIATGTAIATANYLGQKGGLMKAMTAVSLGMAGIYALEIMDDKLNTSYLLNEKNEEISEIK